MPRLGAWFVVHCLTLTGAFAQPQFPLVDRLLEGSVHREEIQSEILLTELNCVVCHQPPASWPLSVRTRSLEDLRGRAAQQAPGYLVSFLANPHQQDSGSLMPDFLGDFSEPERREIAEALWCFLRPRDASKPSREPPRTGAVRQGQSIFERVGCLLCHSKTGPGSVEDFGPKRVLLSRLDSKFTRRGLRQFLADPDSGHGAGSEPRLVLRPDELDPLVAFLLEERELAHEALVEPSRAARERGREHFKSLKCLACHADGDSESLAREDLGPRLIELENVSAGCLSVTPRQGLPRYRLSPDQRRVLVQALDRIDEGTEWGAEDRIERELVRSRCLVCHVRSGKGGIGEALDPYLTSFEADLGDEGRIPPDLTGVGRKLQTQAMISILLGEAPARPYMGLRMPGFDRPIAVDLSQTLGVLDIPENEMPTVRSVAENQVGRNMWGRALIGTGGLNCIACHPLAGHPAQGIQSIDLSLAPNRLRGEWFRDYLMDPARFRPGTRMPAFWPDGVPSLSGQGGSTERQIDSLWAYLNELDQSRLPEGLVNPDELMLNPRGKALVFRTFLEGVGNHAIAVGFESGLHAAFDSLTSRWRLLWRGAFLDAESTWHDRFTPPAQPKGRDVLSLGGGLAGDASPFAFQGYALEEGTGIPEFQYQSKDVLLGDSMRPSRVDPNGFDRTIVALRGDEFPIWIDLASGKQIERENQDWRVDERLRVTTAGEVRWFEIPGGGTLRIGISSLEEVSHIHYRW